MTTTVRATALEVRIGGVLDPTAFAVSCAFGLDQRYAEATVRRTGGGALAISYWDEVEIRIGTTPGAGAPVRFRGDIVPVENALYPIEGTLQCRGYLYRAAWVRNNVSGGTDLAPPGGGGAPDEDMVRAVLTACGVPFVGTNIAGTGKALGSVFIDLNDLLAPGPFTWAERQSGLDFIEQLDDASVPDAGTGKYLTLESLNGEVFRVWVTTVPAAAVEFSFSEGVDVFDARITRDPTGAANRVVVTGAPAPLPGIPSDLLENGGTERFVAGTSDAPYLPGLPDGPDGFPAVTFAFGSPLIEKSLVADPGDVLACEAVAAYLLGEHNAVIDTLEFSTPRDDLLGPGQTIHLESARLGLTDPDRHYWVQHLEITLDERGAFTQRLRCLRRS